MQANGTTKTYLIQPGKAACDETLDPGLSPQGTSPAQRCRVLTMRYLLLALGLASLAQATPIPAELAQGGWFIGTQAWTFNRFTTFEAIAKTKEAGGNVIEIYPGQKLRAGSDAKVGHDMSDAALAELKAECARQGVRAVNYGVVSARDAAEVRRIMQFASKLGLYAVSTESAERVADWEAAAREFDIRVAFHQHPGSMSNPGYKVWHPLYILGVVESRDARLGACVDLGHWCASDLKPVECLRILKGRIISVHLKDKAKFGPADIVVAGQGVADVGACLEELNRQGFSGHISVEHEADWENNVPQARASIDFVRARKR